MGSFGNERVVEGLWRPLSDDEKRHVIHLLFFASNIIRVKVPDVDERIGDGKLSADLAAQVAASMVIRVMKNPDAHKQESIDDFSFQIDEALATGSLYLGDDELHLLRGRKGKAFSISQRQPIPTIPDLEQVALVRAQHDALWPTGTIGRRRL